MKKYMLPVALIILIAYISCGGENHSPVINDITFSQTDIYPQDNVICTVDAEDEDEDPLTFTWSATAGDFSSTTGVSVTWTAPNDTGEYTITVVAEDEGGLTDSLSKDIDVKPTWTYGENTNSVQILDGYGSWSTIEISSAPATAEVDSMQVTVSITHSNYSDLWIYLMSPDSVYTTLWGYDYPGGNQTIVTDIFAGRPVNGDWTLWVFDDVINGEEGLLNEWSIIVFWEL